MSDVAFSPDGKTIATGVISDQFFTEGRALLWDVRTAQELQTLHGHLGQVVNIAFRPDNTQVATCSNDCTTMIWEPLTGKVIQTLIGHTQPVHTLAWSPDGTRIVTGGADLTLRLWDARTGKEVHRSKVSEPVSAVAFHPDGAFLASASAGPLVRLWDAATGTELRTLPGRRVVAFSPDGKRLATNAAIGNDLKILNVADGRERATLSGNGAPTVALAFEAEGRLLATTAEDGSVRVWDSETGKEICCLCEKAARVGGAAFSPDGRLLAAVVNNRVLVWERTRWKRN